MTKVINEGKNAKKKFYVAYLYIMIIYYLTVTVDSFVLSIIDRSNAFIYVPFALGSLVAGNFALFILSLMILKGDGKLLIKSIASFLLLIDFTLLIYLSRTAFLPFRMFYPFIVNTSIEYVIYNYSILNFYIVVVILLHTSYAMIFLQIGLTVCNIKKHPDVKNLLMDTLRIPVIGSIKCILKSRSLNKEGITKRNTIHKED